MELLLVVVILAALSALVVPKVDFFTDQASGAVARATLQTVREAITGSASEPGYLADMKPLPGFRSVDFTLHHLLSLPTYPGAVRFDPVAQRGWRGPYLRNEAADPWGNPIVVQIPPETAFSRPTNEKRFHYARLISAGPDGIVSTPLDVPGDPDLARLAGLVSDGKSPARGDDLVLFLNRADIHEVEEP
jgi:type II secretory pathway pseudopilin PulG